MRVVPSEGEKMKEALKAEVERILQKMKTTEDSSVLREYALTVESLVMSIGRLSN